MWKFFTFLSLVRRVSESSKPVRTISLESALFAPPYVQAHILSGTATGLLLQGDVKDLSTQTRIILACVDTAFVVSVRLRTVIRAKVAELSQEHILKLGVTSGKGSISDLRSTYPQLQDNSRVTLVAWDPFTIKGILATGQLDDSQQLQAVTAVRRRLDEVIDQYVDDEEVTVTDGLASSMFSEYDIDLDELLPEEKEQDGHLTHVSPPSSGEFTPLDDDDLTKLRTL